MNTSHVFPHTLLAIGVSSILLAACTAAPFKPEGADNLRPRLTRLQSNPELASRAPLALKEAELAVTNAEMAQTDKAIATHLVYIADRKINIAEAQAENRLALDQRKVLAEQREAMRLQARTKEADAANQRATAAETDAGIQRQQAQTDRMSTLDAERNSRELQQQIDELQAKVTDRGLVLTLSDVLFTSGTAQMNVGESANMGKLAVFLNKHPDHTAVIEGHTDNVGNDGNNEALSQRRADAVKSHLVTREGIDSRRLTTLGKGESSPVADNGSSQGRQQNRRVEVIIAQVSASRGSYQQGHKFPVAKQPAGSPPSQ
jgi:outer membrane protein OmpA-like peptidoglycan-associated protein